MILDSLTHHQQYVHLHPLFSAAFDFLRAHDPATPDSRIDLDGDRLFALVQRLETAPEETRVWEAHRGYGDIQFIVSGREKILYSPVRDLTSTGPYDADKDVEKFTGESALGAVPLIVPPGSFAIFLPQDGHKPGCTVEGPEPVTKVVIKFRLIG